MLVAKVQEALEHQLTHRVQQGIARMLLLRTACRGGGLVVFGPGQQHGKGRHNLTDGKLTIACRRKARRLGGEQLGAAQT